MMITTTTTTSNNDDLAAEAAPMVCVSLETTLCFNLSNRDRPARRQTLDLYRYRSYSMQLSAPAIDRRRCM